MEKGMSDTIYVTSCGKCGFPVQVVGDGQVTRHIDLTSGEAHVCHRCAAGRSVYVSVIGAPLHNDDRSYCMGERCPKYLGGCTCTFKAPTIPTCRDPMQHLDDCPAKGTGYPVGAWTYDAI